MFVVQFAGVFAFEGHGRQPALPDPAGFPPAGGGRMAAKVRHSPSGKRPDAVFPCPVLRLAPHRAAHLESGMAHGGVAAGRRHPHSAARRSPRLLPDACICRHGPCARVLPHPQTRHLLRTVEAPVPHGCRHHTGPQPLPHRWAQAWPAHPDRMAFGTRYPRQFAPAAAAPVVAGEL